LTANSIMHGQRRADYKARQRDPKVAAGLQQKADHWRKLTAQLPLVEPSVALEVTETLLKVNPDPSYVWNHRRTIILEQGIDLEKELKLTAASLQSNPKSYGAWFHRKWVLAQPKIASPPILAQEIGLTELFLQRDERNFHCWNYRRFVVSLQLSGLDGSWTLRLEDGDEPRIVMGAQVVLAETEGEPASGTALKEILDQEWAFTSQKIRQNFSNFSAFHYRSKLLPLVSTADLADEFSLLEDAVYTEPDDQTAWWYQAFLLDSSTDAHVDRIRQHLESLRELAEEVTECKWVRLGMLACLGRLPDSDSATKVALWDELIEMDPDRAVRYRHMRAKLE
jgi:geranylgeranyl transferase type-2 subunit alpha